MAVSVKGIRKPPAVDATFQIPHPVFNNPLFEFLNGKKRVEECGHFSQDFLNARLVCKNWNEKWNAADEERWSAIRERLLPSLKLNPQESIKTQCLAALQQLKTRYNKAPLFESRGYDVAKPWMFWRNRAFILQPDKQSITGHLFKPHEGVIARLEPPFSTEHGERIKSFKIGYGMLVACTDGYHTKFYVWNIETGVRHRWMSNLSVFAFYILDKKTLATQSEEGKIALFDLIPLDLQEPAIKVILDCMLPNCNTVSSTSRMVFAGLNSMIAVFNRSTGQILRRIGEPGGFSSLFAFQDRLLIGYYAGPPALLNLDTWEKTDFPKPPIRPLRSSLPARYSQVGNWLWQSDGNNVCLYDISHCHWISSHYLSATHSNVHFFDERLWIEGKEEKEGMLNVKLYEFGNLPEEPPPEPYQQSAPTFCTKLWDAISDACLCFLSAVLRILRFCF